ncbi:MAG3450 family membrane protein, partial [Mycoplasma tauri]
MNKSKKETTILNYGPLLTILMITIFVVIPMTVIWVLSSSIFNNVLIKELKWVIILVLMISIFGILINLLFVYLKIISIRSFNFNIPVIFAFIGLIFSSLYLNEIWQVFLITLSSAIISAI